MRRGKAGTGLDSGKGTGVLAFMWGNPAPFQVNRNWRRRWAGRLLLHAALKVGGTRMSCQGSAPLELHFQSQSLEIGGSAGSLLGARNPSWLGHVPTPNQSLLGDVSMPLTLDQSGLSPGPGGSFRKEPWVWSGNPLTRWCYVGLKSGLLEANRMSRTGRNWASLQAQARQRCLRVQAMPGSGESRRWAQGKGSG